MNLTLPFFFFFVWIESKKEKVKGFTKRGQRRHGCSIYVSYQQTKRINISMGRKEALIKYLFLLLGYNCHSYIS